MDAGKVQQLKSTFQSLAYGTAMEAAARDYQKACARFVHAAALITAARELVIDQVMYCAQEMLAAGHGSAASTRAVDIDDFLDDPELERLHSERLAALQREVEKRAVLQRKGHGELQEARAAEALTRDDCVSYTANTICLLGGAVGPGRTVRKRASGGLGCRQGVCSSCRTTVVCEGVRDWVGRLGAAAGHFWACWALCCVRRVPGCHIACTLWPARDEGRCVLGPHSTRVLDKRGRSSRRYQAVWTRV